MGGWSSRRRFTAPFLALVVTVAAGVAATTIATAVAAPVPPAGGGKLVLTDGVRTVVRQRAQLGIGKPQPGHAVPVDRALLVQALRRLAPAFAQELRDARPYVEHGAVRLFSGQDGRTLNVGATADRIIAALAKKPTRTHVEVDEEKHSPQVTASALRGITGVLGAFQTIATANPKRNHNIAVAVSRIDGTILPPGATFSLNHTVGKRTHATGFLTAHVFVDAKVVPGVGGGVSQVTGTLFNAAALAGLPIKEVHPHSRPVAYLPLGRDATVAYGAEDLKFTNNTKAPVYIAYAFQHQTLHAIIFGEKVPGRTVALRPLVHRLGPGKINAQLYRVVKENGRLIAKERIFTHAYRWDAHQPAA